MIVSRCHKTDVILVEYTGGSYYVCSTCHKVTETFCVMVLSDLQDMYDDPFTDE